MPLSWREVVDGNVIMALRSEDLRGMLTASSVRLVALYSRHFVVIDWSPGKNGFNLICPWPGKQQCLNNTDPHRSTAKLHTHIHTLVDIKIIIQSPVRRSYS